MILSLHARSLPLHPSIRQALWGMETPGQANDQRDLAILANKKKVRARAREKHKIFHCLAQMCTGAGVGTRLGHLKATRAVPMATKLGAMGLLAGRACAWSNNQPSGMKGGVQAG